MSVLVLVILAAALQPASSPIVVATLEADFNHDGRADMLQVIQTSGVAYVDDKPWCGESYGQLKYEGRFALRVRLGGHRPVDTDLNRLLSEEKLAFVGRGWPIFARPLTGDGTLQFTLGQYGCCATWTYHVFGIDRSGRVIVLSPELANGDRQNSTEAIYPTEKGFLITEVAGWGDPPPKCVEYLWSPASRSFALGDSEPGDCEDDEDEGDDSGAT